MPAEDSNQVARRCRDWSTVGNVTGIFCCAHYDNDVVRFSLQCVGVGLIEIKHHSRNERSGAVLAGSHTAHSVRVHRNILDVFAEGRVRKVEKNPIRMKRRFHGGLYWSTERDVNAYARAVARCSHTLHGRGSARLCRGTRQQEHQYPEMFLN
jgi:hypothetical protein